MMKQDRLLANILNSFSSVQYPESLDFNLAIAHRDYSDKPYNNGKRVKWDEINREGLRKYHEFIFFLENEGVMYYLPTYLVHILNDNQLAEEISDVLFMALGKIEISLFTSDQINCLIEFLRVCENVISKKFELDEVLLKEALNHFQMNL